MEFLKKYSKSFLTDMDVTPERSGHAITPAQQHHGCRCIGFGMYLCTIEMFRPQSSAIKEEMEWTHSEYLLR